LSRRPARYTQADLTDEFVINIMAEAILANDPKPDLVYFIRGATTKKIKIGHSRDAFSRFDQIMAATGDGFELLGFAYGGVRLEKLLHVHLREYRGKGEWFRNVPPVHECLINMMDCNGHVVRAWRKAGGRHA
jgi:hypothetical protein